MPAHPPFTPLPDPDAVLLAKVRAQYEAGEATLVEAARALGFSKTTLNSRIANKWFWRVPERLAATKARRTLREAARIKAPRQPRALQHKPIAKSELSPKALHRRLMVEIARLMRAVEADVNDEGLPNDPERHAKIMGAVVKLQADAARLNELIKPQPRERAKDGAADAANPDDFAAADVARLRADLAQKLSGGLERSLAHDATGDLQPKADGGAERPLGT